MSKKFTELRFEEWVEQSLLKNGYHHSFTHSNAFESKYNKELCLVEEDVIAFIKSTQPEEYNKLYSQFDSATDLHLLISIDKTIAQRGIIDTLRGGIETRGCTFNLVYFKPKSSLNQDHQKLYALNRFVVVRQLHYSTRNRNSIDMVLVLNGIPIVTLELKNQLTGQNIKHSENQYKHDRDPKERLLNFQRCLVHFCVDNDRVSMATHLNGPKTKFLPYNKGITNPVAEGNYKTEYLWNEILTPDSLLDIIENFVLVSEEEDKEWDNQKGRVVTKKFKVQIFPRYHQLDAIRKLRNAVKQQGVGKKYLIQHTTGSGKSYSIGWLAHMLTSLYRNENDTKRMFDTILVVTDRKVLDKQLQSTVAKLEQTAGVVNPVELGSTQLKEYLEKGKDIIITTVQKFPFISQAIAELKGNTFGVVIDEVHSSQSGETSKHLKKSLSVNNTEADDNNTEEEDLEDLIRKEIEARGNQKHISFFGFTGTPKPKTLRLFGQLNEAGKHEAFHSYTMEQSIHEGFTLDVLRSYTTYNRYFKVQQKSENNEELPESKANRELVNFVDSHEETIRQKVAIILDHFVNQAAKKINGKARAMVVVRSRKHCVLFHEEMVKQMKARNLPYSCLVGFSGTIIHNGKENTEQSLNTENGLVNTSIPNGLKDPRFRILIVSNKFQTGFDEPLLQAMYVDKMLRGVQCVQTLSRLNRTTSGKTDTFILDFANDTDDIIESFQPFYTTTILKDDTDPDMLYQKLYEIEQYNLYTSYQLNEFCKEFYAKTTSDEKLHAIIDVVVEAFIERLSPDEQEEYKSKLQGFIRLYSYVSQIASFAEVKWEKAYIFFRFLNKKLPKRESERLSLVDAIDLDSLRIQMMGETALTLAAEPGELYGTPSGEAAGKGEEELTLLSEIIQKINELHGSALGEEDRITLEHIEQRMQENESLKKVLTGNNTQDVKLEYFSNLLMDTFIEYFADRQEFYKNTTRKDVFPMLVDVMFTNVSKYLGAR